MIRIAFLLLLAVVIGLVIFGLFLPREIVIERDRVMDHPREILFEVLQDLRHFPHWSPWFDHSPNTEFRFERPGTGVGSSMAWTEPRSGRSGRLWVVGVSRLDAIDLQLELGEVESELAFAIERAAEPGYRVRWSMRMEVGPLDLVGRYTGLLLQRLVGRDYAEGLERLDRYLDQTPGRVPSLPDVDQGERPSAPSEWSP
ncbi:MAG: hypothetical protein ACXIUM_11135 [Wenzhouxiangella sp.]